MECFFPNAKTQLKPKNNFEQIQKQQRFFPSLIFASEGWSLPEWSSIKVGSEPCPKILD